MKKIITILLTVFVLFGCSSQPSQEVSEKTSYKIGICNYVDDASLNQINDNIQSQLKKISEENNVEFTISYSNCNADANLMNQIISNFIAQEVDLMVGIATPVAMAMQAATEENQIPVIFAAVSDPFSAGLVDSLEVPGANISGTSDYLDTNSIMKLITVLNPQISKVGLLYDLGQDASTTAIKEAKQFLEENNIEFVERCGTNVSEIQLAADALIEDKAEAIFTPSDNTVMKAELSIYEKLSEAGIPHYAGADSFALNGAFLGYGVDYANLGKETAEMVKEVLINGKEISSLPVRTFANGIATINTETCEKLSLNYDSLKELFAPYCSLIQPIQTSEEFE